MALLTFYPLPSLIFSLVQTKKPFSLERPIPPSTAIAGKASSSAALCRSTIGEEPPALCPSRRSLAISIAALLSVSSFPRSKRATDAMAEELELERFTDMDEGFTLLRPSSYIKVEKSGATVLFEEANKGSNNVGVVVNPVRISNLKDFGSPEFVADKIIQVEKHKESTKAVEVISVAERPGFGGLPVYEFEYKVDSTRGGMKRIFTAAFVASRKLYLLNIAHSDKPESPLDAHVRTKLEQVLHSFDAASLT